MLNIDTDYNDDEDTYFEWKPLNKLKSGEFFKRKPDANKVYTKEHYNREDKTFTCVDTDDIGRCIFLKSTTKVCVGFTY